MRQMMRGGPFRVQAGMCSFGAARTSLICTRLISRDVCARSAFDMVAPPSYFAKWTLVSRRLRTRASQMPREQDDCRLWSAC